MIDKIMKIKMTIRNFTPHSFDVYCQSQFMNFEQVSPTTFIADGVEGEPILSLPSEGSVRIATSTEELGIDSNGVPAFKTVYGEASGFPTDLNELLKSPFRDRLSQLAIVKCTAKNG
jgi:hypothetical protein